MLYIFDLDGTLIDNERAVREAYRMAGVIMPDNAFGKTADEWKTYTPAQKDIKKVVYAEMLRRYASAGPAMPHWLHAQERIIITGASYPGALDTLDFLGIGTWHLKLTGATISKKVEFIKSELDRTIVYVDCCKDTALEIKEKAKCGILIP